MLGTAAGKMGASKMMEGQKGKGANKRHDIGLEASKAPDMSQYAQLGSISSLLNQNAPQQQQYQQQQPSVDDFIKSLLG